MSSDAPEAEVGPMEKQMVELSDQQLRDYETIYDPLAKEAVSKSRELGTESFRQHNKNVAAASAREARSSFGVGAGAAPVMKKALIDKGVGDSVSTADASSQGELLAKNTEVNRKLGVAQMGRGQSQTATQNYGNAAAREYAESVTKANADASKDATKSSAVGTVAGIGAGYWLNQPQTPKLNMQGQSKPLNNNTAFIKNI
ncbi:hypothetical protein [Endozoicomonas arenosclerae]|uniref:hypothetical protein n=1 Tax=Endozoicomonas arenosclerae TaxID=1633495 RepID=UPI00078492BA|nr:hypothetical protein [Endozoicomonas arenosclerae]